MPAYSLKYLEQVYLEVPPLAMMGILGLLLWFGLRLEPPAAGGRVESWTGLRWLVSMTIFLEHVGYGGVSCSGWFIMMSGAMLSLGRGGGGTCVGWWRFLVRRLARIFPAYWVVLIFRFGPSNIAWSDWHTFAGIDDFVEGHNLWFISTVIHLYMLYPFISMFAELVGTQKSVTRALGVAAGAYCIQLMAAYYLFQSSDDPMAPIHPNQYQRTVFGCVINFYHNPFTRLPLFLMGICCAHASQQISESWIRKLGILTDLSLGLFLLIAVANILIKENCSQFLYGTLCTDSIFLRTTMHSPLLFVNMLGLGVRSNSLSQWIFTRPIILLLGKWSYGVYLWGFPVAGQLIPVLPTLGFYAKTVSLAAVSFNVFEEPAQKWATWITTPAPVEMEEALSSSTDSDEESMMEMKRLAE